MNSETENGERLLAALADEKRRCIVAYLSDSSGDVASLSELARHVDAHCSTAGDEDQVAITLHHADLPKLEEAGALEYDSRDTTVRYQPGPKVERLLGCLGEHGL